MVSFALMVMVALSWDPCLDCAGAVANCTPAPSKPSKSAKVARGGAVAEGDRVALSGTAMGGRPVEVEDVGFILVGAVEPPARRGLRLTGLGPADGWPSRLGLAPRGPFPSFPHLSDFSPRSVELAAAAICAAFLFFLSMDILCPGKIWAKAHLWPNLQVPFTNHAQVSFWVPGSTRLWENGHEEPAVHPPTLKNLQGTCERSLAMLGQSVT